MIVRALLFMALGFIVTAASPLRAADYRRYRPTQAEHNVMLRDLDQVFRWAGVRRLGELQDLECSESKSDATCTAKVFLDVDGNRRPYNIELEGKPRKLTLAAFYPDEPTPPDVKARGFYTPDQNTIRDPKLRAFAVAAVTKFSRHLRWHWVSGPAIHREGRNLLVTYHVFSDEESKRAAYVEPTLVTFYVSPRGTICGALYSE
jgi:hypothetical protein